MLGVERLTNDVPVVYHWRLRERSMGVVYEVPGRVWAQVGWRVIVHRRIQRIDHGKIIR